MFISYNNNCYAMYLCVCVCVCVCVCTVYHKSEYTPHISADI